MSVNPDIIGVIFVLDVIGFIALYAWLDFKKRPSPSASPKPEPSPIKCSNCGGLTDQINGSSVKCRYCGSITPNPSKDDIEPQNLDERKQAVKETQEHIAKSVFPDIEYKSSKIVVKDPFVSFAQDAEYMRKKHKDLDGDVKEL